VPTTVKRVIEYPSFEEMLDREEARSIGGDLGESRENLLAEAGESSHRASQAHGSRSSIHARVGISLKRCCGPRSAPVPEPHAVVRIGG
jgi:hypothetical protein